jgi:phytol kinase
MSATSLLHGCLLSLLGAAWMAGLAELRRAGLAPEWCRKLLHMGCGSLALSLPWMFASVQAVLFLSACVVLMLGGVRYLPSWNRKLGGVLDGVGRGHRGGLYFAAAIGLVFAAAAGDRLLFCLPIAVLTFADAAAALVGRRMGTHRFRAAGGWKTLEGSGAFFTVTLVCAVGCLGAWDGGSPSQALPLAALLSLLLTFVEASAGRGTDNLLIPVVCHLALRYYLGRPAAMVAVHLGATAVAGGWMVWSAWRGRVDIPTEPWRAT